MLVSANEFSNHDVFSVIIWITRTPTRSTLLSQERTMMSWRTSLIWASRWTRRASTTVTWAITRKASTRSTTTRQSSASTTTTWSSTRISRVSTKMTRRTLSRISIVPSTKVMKSSLWISRITNPWMSQIHTVMINLLGIQVKETHKGIQLVWYSEICSISIFHKF